MILSNPVDIDHLGNGSGSPILTGQVCFASLTNKDEVDDLTSRGYIQQPSVAIPGSANVLTAYVQEDIVKQLQGRDVFIAPYVAYSFFKQQAVKHRRSIFALVVNTGHSLQSEFYVFRKGSLESLSSHNGFDHLIVNRVRQQDNRDIKIFAYCVGDVARVGFDADVLEYVDTNPFEYGKGLSGLISRFTTVKGQRLLAGAENRFSSVIKPFFVPLIMCFIALVTVPAYSLYKQMEFGFVKGQFEEVADSQEGLPEQAQLNMWEARSHFIEALDAKDLTTSVIQELLQNLSTASKKAGSGAAYFERMDINLSEPSDVNGKTYNVILEVGIPVSQKLSPEELTARFAAALTDSLGRAITGSVDVWDDVVKRQVNGRNYVFARFYLMREVGGSDEFIN